MTNYLITVRAEYHPDHGSPETLASSVTSTMLDFEYSLTLRDFGDTEAPFERRYVGLFTLDGHHAEAPGWALTQAIGETDPVNWSVCVYELDEDDPSLSVVLGWRLWA